MNANDSPTKECIDSMTPRAFRALTGDLCISAVSDALAGTFTVRDGSEAFEVDLRADSCTCPDSRLSLPAGSEGSEGCSHRQHVRMALRPGDLSEMARSLASPGLAVSIARFGGLRADERAPVTIEESAAEVVRAIEARISKPESEPAAAPERESEPEPVLLTDGGAAIEETESDSDDSKPEPRTVRAATESMTVSRGSEPGEFSVLSQSGNTYTYALGGGCSCPDEEHNSPAGGCKHSRRVKMEIGLMEVPDLPGHGRPDVEVMIGARKARVARRAARKAVAVTDGGAVIEETEPEPASDSQSEPAEPDSEPCLCELDPDGLGCFEHFEGSER